MFAGMSQDVAERTQEMESDFLGQIPVLPLTLKGRPMAWPAA